MSAVAPYLPELVLAAIAVPVAWIGWPFWRPMPADPLERLALKRYREDWRIHA